MAKQRKVRIDRLLIVILSAILIIGLLGLGIYALVNLISKNKSNNTVVGQNETVEGINISLVDYEVYIDDKNTLGFNFVIAELSFDGKDKISFNLNDLQTSEKVSLGNVSKDLAILEENGYKVSKLDIVESISSDSNYYKCKVFIPYTTSSDYLQVFNSSNPTTKLNFDLSENNKYVTSLKFDTDQEITIGNNSIYVSSCFISTMMEHNGVSYSMPETVKMFTFKINVVDVDDNVCIEEALFIKDGSDKKIKCRPAQYNSVKVDNIIGKNLVKGENGALFFEIISNEEQPNYAGVLMLKLSNSEDWIKINTVLE